MNDLNYLSISRINLFEQCPLKFKFKYIDKIKKPIDQIALKKGRYIHKMIEKDLQENLKEIKDNEFKTITKEILCCLNKSKSYQQLKKSKDKLIEKWFEFYINDIKFVGMIDLFHQINEKTGLLIDWKTGKSIPSEFQLLLYSVYLFHEFENIQIIYAYYWFVELNKKIKYIYKREYIDKYIQIIKDKINTILNTKEFLPKNNIFCFDCEYSEECLQWKLQNKFK